MDSATPRILAALAVSILLAPAMAWGATTVPQQIEFADTTSVRTKVLKQCKLQTQIPAAIAANASDVRLVGESANLSLEISEVHAPAGWIFAGPRWVEVKGTLAGKAFRAKRYSSFDPFAGGTCGVLAKIAKSLGSDIALWLQDPTPNAALGDAQ